MFKPSVLKIAALIIAGYGILALPGFFWPAYLDSPASIVALVPLLSVYMFHKVGVPGLLEHNGLCGWGWCSPTVFGWAFAAVFWVMAVWLAAWGRTDATGGAVQMTPTQDGDDTEDHHC